MSAAGEPRTERVRRLQDAMTRDGIGLTAIAPTDNLRWALGYAPHYDERACLLLVSTRAAAMVMPALNAEATAAHAPEIELVRWVDEDGPQDALAAALHRLGISAPGDGQRPGAPALAADPEMRADHLLLLQDALPGMRSLDAGRLLWPLREIKDDSELARLRRAAAVADRAVQAAWAACADGVSELAVGEVIDRAFRDEGARPQFAIVGSGPNGAFPHHAPDPTHPRVLGDGDAIVIDVGAMSGGYHSDITRMAHLGEPGERYRQVHRAVEAAVTAAIAATRPGATCGAVDDAARTVIQAAGFGEFFVHRTGHGLGLSGHEPPYVMAGSDVVLRAGMVHSIEPGIYLPGEFGVRLEEIVIVTPDGCERLSALPRDVHVV